MEHNVVRRRGKPNRGGGRGNRGGGNRGGGGGRGRGRGRGGDSPRGRGGGGGGRGGFGGARGGGGGGRGGGGPGGRGGGGGLGGRKVGDICDEDFSLVDQHDDYDDDVDFEDAPPIASFAPSSSGRGKPGRAASAPTSAPTSAPSVPSASAAPPPPPSSAPRGRRVMQKHKVPMQKLHMSADNQDIVRDMLKQLHGGQDLDLGAAEYGTLDWRANDQYWMKDNRLVIQGTKHNEDEDENNKIYEDYINQKALRKLQKYGFDKSRCRNALDKHGGDIGRSLEYLASKCFNVPLEGSSTTSDNAHTQEEINDAREDEKMVLGEMYPDSFREKVKNHVWTVSLEIPTLDKWCEGKLDKKAKMQQQIEDSKQKKEACRFFLKGSCKFSADNCRYLHQTPDVLERKKQEEANKLKAAKVAIKKDTYTIEVRFPKGNRYPLECPFVLFSCDNSLVPGSVCLHISERLMTEAKAMAEEGTPAVYSLVLIIENEEEINAILKKPEHKFNGPEPMISRKQMLEQLNPPPVQEDRGYEDLELMSRSKEGEEEVVTAKKATQKDIVRKDMNPNEVKRINRTLKERFRQKQDTSAYKKMVEHRRTLPAWGSQAEILTKLRDSQVLVISGMTGCGKSTQVPQFILDSYMHTKGGDCCNIVCTQPRRISAMAVAERVAQERIEAVGGSVGYQIRLESVMSSRTRLLFCTTGILLRRLEGDHKLSGVTHVIVDEVHERSEESDFLMMILRDMLELRPDLRVILMSATLNADLFSEYFHDCGVIDIPGKTFPVEQYFLEDAIQMTRYVLEEKSKFARPLKSMNAVRQDNLGKDNRSLPLQDIETALANTNVQSVAPPKDNICDENLSVPQLYRRYSGYKKSTIKTMALMDYEKINYDLIERLVEYIVEGDHELPEEGAVLVFLPGMAEITTMYEQLRGNKLLSRRKTRLIPLHSTLSSEEQKMVFNKPPEGTTKIVLATNIAETSITIDDIVFVIDAGRMKEKRYDASKGMESLDTVWVSKANAMQRSGRAGRVCKGVCFHLFSGHRFDFNMRDQPIPEIQRAPLEQIILKIKMLQIFSGNDVKMVLAKLIEGPAESSIDTALQRLHDLGALDDAWQLTALGIHLAALPVDVRIGKLMLFGAIFRCLDPALTIAACLSFKSPFVAPFGKKEEADAKKLTFATGNSDHLTMWKAYKEWMEKEKNSSYSGYTFCQENYLSIKSLQMLASMKRQFVELLSDIGFVQEGLTARDVERIGGRGRRGDGVAQATGQLANVNSENMKLVAAILVAALYPNIVQISVPENKYMQVGAGAVPTAPKAQEIKFRTKQDGYINIHPSSVNFQVRFYESPYLVYHEKVKTSKVYVRDCSMVSVYPLLLFAGGAISVDLHDGQFVLSVDDGWIRFLAESHEVAELVRGMRQEMDQLLQDKIENPSLDLCNCPRGNTIISVIVKLISTQ